jgi:hypothetical protein
MQLGYWHMHLTREKWSHWNGIAGRMWCKRTGTQLDVGGGNNNNNMKTKNENKIILGAKRRGTEK